MKMLIAALAVAFGVNGEPVPRELQLKAERYAKLQQEKAEREQEFQRQLDNIIIPEVQEVVEPTEPIEPVESKEETPIEITYKNDKALVSTIPEVVDVVDNGGIIVVKLDVTNCSVVTRKTKLCAMDVLDKLNLNEVSEVQFWAVQDDKGKVCSFTVKDFNYSKKKYNLKVEDFWLSPAVNK